MSGFGGGGGGFGTPGPAPFGSSSGFGHNNNAPPAPLQGFGTPVAPPLAPFFGAAAASAPTGFGTTASGFGTSSFPAPNVAPPPHTAAAWGQAPSMASAAAAAPPFALFGASSASVTSDATTTIARGGAPSHTSFGQSSGFGGPGNTGFNASNTISTYGTPSHSTFGSGSGGFGGSTTNTFGGGFGSNNNPQASFGAAVTTPFGTTAPAPTMSFAAPTTTFATASTSTYGGPTTGFSTAPPFAAAAAPPNSALPPAFGNPPFGSVPTAAMAFGNSSFAASNPFGSSASQPAPISGFGSSSFAAPPLFGSNANTFGSSNPFGQSTAAAATPSMTFGTSSGFHADFAMSTSSPIPFGIPRQAMSSMHQLSDNEMEDEHAATAQAPASNLPFGNPHFASLSSGGNPWSASGLGPIPESEMNDPTIQGVVVDEDGQSKELAALKARLEAKKKKFRERMDRAAATTAAVAKSKDTSKKPALSANATPFAPKSSGGDGGGAATTTTTSTTLAHRNLERFGALGRQSPVATNMSSSLTIPAPPAHRDTLANAKTLLGTCLGMCPDEERERRTREDDVQLLERPRPGELHPPDWTLQNTMIKRFRRSAADYKLDVPEWVRPPDVLERVCGYLEEWVMERDRQGPDPRFPEGITPPSLDVYQFIWDRTRMIRKDFILQNYVGTGGMCDARAVRCHERIARWHAMCEHQLSHIQDFAVQQSQQNIQELGQTMKTLNQYYDDSLGRHLVEVPDAAGNETRPNLRGLTHGCETNIVQGRNPVEFDGTLLSNGNDQRVEDWAIGRHAVERENHGTCEPEMRGLYILLTIDNDGGMEVLNYAAKLFRERSEIYHCRLVQLALSVYKAKREYNYARFFSILRSPSTPYLYACVMYKHVEQMRLVAIRVMCKAFGGRSREDSTPMYDSFPLSDLVRLLAFEDAEEAQSACQHYNITVKLAKRESDGQIEETVFWKHTLYKDPKDPDKGTIIPLRPRKMMRTIESKLNGATRLAVCRGGGTEKAVVKVGKVSAATETLATSLSVALDTSISGTTDSEVSAARRKAEFEEIRFNQERSRTELELRRLADEKRKADEIIQKNELLKQKRMKDETEARQREQHRIELEKMARENAARERRHDELEREKVRRDEENRCRQEKEARALHEKHLRLVEEQQKREARAHEERQRQDYEERLRQQQEEDKRQAALVQKENERRLGQERRLNLEWNERAMKARKKLIWLRWARRLPTNLQILEVAEHSIAGISLFRTRESVNDDDWVLPASKLVCPCELGNTDLRRVIDAEIRAFASSSGLLMNMAKMITTHLLDRVAHTRRRGRKETYLYSVGVLFPSTDDMRYRSLCELCRVWINAAVSFGVVAADFVGDDEVRLVWLDCVNHTSANECDFVVVVAPSSFNVAEPFTSNSLMRSWQELGDGLDVSQPRLVLSINDSFGHSVAERRNSLLCSIFSGSSESLVIVDNSKLSGDALSQSILAAGRAIASFLASETPRQLQAISVDQLVCQLIGEVVWSFPPSESRDDLLRLSREAAKFLAIVVDELRADMEDEWNWPSVVFFEDAVGAPDYFGSNNYLPRNWLSRLSYQFIQQGSSRTLNILSQSFPVAIQALLHGASAEVVDECTHLLNLRMFRRCLQSALFWRTNNQPGRIDRHYVYMPTGMLGQVVQKVALMFTQKQFRDFPISIHPSENSYAERNDFSVESIDLPPLETPILESRLRMDIDFTSTQPAEIDCNLKRPRADSRNTEVDSVPHLLESRLRVDKRLKRRSSAKGKPMTKDRMESLAFSVELERMAAGDSVEEMFVGNTTLSALLRGSSNPLLPMI